MGRDKTRREGTKLDRMGLDVTGQDMTDRKERDEIGYDDGMKILHNPNYI